MHDKQKGVDIDLTEISLSGYPEISDWCITLGCSEIQLAEAVAVVGYLPARVLDYLAAGSGFARLRNGAAPPPPPPASALKGG